MADYVRRADRPQLPRAPARRCPTGRSARRSTRPNACCATPKAGPVGGAVPDLKAAAPKAERPAPLVPRARADRRALARGRPDRSRAPGADVGEGRPDPRLRALLRSRSPASSGSPTRWSAGFAAASSGTRRPASRNRNDVPRRVIVDTLILAGLRVSELCGLDVGARRHRRRALRVPRSATKTDAGERVVPTVPALRERLAEHRMDHPEAPRGPRSRHATARASNPTTSARGSSPRSCERANELLEADGRAPIAPPDAAHAAAHLRLDPRRLRRPAAARDVPAGPHRPEAHARRLPAGARHGRGSVAPRGVLGATLAEARADLQRRGRRGPGFSERIRNRARNKPSARDGELARGGLRNQPICRDSQRADEGTRTLDLLHGKQTL